MLKNVSFLISMLLLVQPAAIAADAAAGKAKSATCTACHGQDGNGVDALPLQPRLAGQHAKYLAKQIHDYKSGARENAIMAPMVAALSDEDIDNLAAYYASLQGATGDSNPDKMDLGQRLYRAGDASKGLAACMACHGPSGRGNPAANYPSLTGQYSAYSAATLKAFKAGQRANDLNGVMRNIAAKMTDEEIEAVSDYIEGLH